jgi:hypothetical protein
MLGNKDKERPIKGTLKTEAASSVPHWEFQFCFDVGENTLVRS